MNRTRIKFCGVQHEADVILSTELGVDAIGCIFAPSPRRIQISAAQRLAASIPPLMSFIGVVVNPTLKEMQDLRVALPAMIPQFCGDETPQECEALSAGGPYLKVQHFAAHQPGLLSANTDYRGLLVVDTQSVDQRGGTGQTFEWQTFIRPRCHFVLAGGLRPENVAEGIRILRPYGVDVRSGIESAGRKDHGRMRAFVQAVQQADKERADGS